MLKPYFLRRTKDLVLNLPPLVSRAKSRRAAVRELMASHSQLEVVVPVSMTVLQRKIYRGILERNAGAIRSIVQKSGTSTNGRAKPKKSNFRCARLPLTGSSPAHRRSRSRAQQHPHGVEESALSSLSCRRRDRAAQCHAAADPGQPHRSLRQVRSPGAHASEASGCRSSRSDCAARHCPPVELG